MCFVVFFVAGQDNAQEPGAHVTGTASEDTLLLLQETQQEPRLGAKHSPHTHTQIHTHTYIHTYTQTHTYIHTYIHTHTHCSHPQRRQMTVILFSDGNTELGYWFVKQIPF